MKTFTIFIIVFLVLSLNTPAQDLPPVKLDYASYVLSSDGRVIGYFGEKRRVEVKSTSSISKYVIWCLIATEDRDFYNHDGVSYKGLVRGILKTITGNTQGGSTLTMQLARNLFLSSEKTLGRKINEIDLARKLEQKYSKDQILLLYLNTVYFGRGANGIWAAAQEYFQKTPDELSVTESALLVGLLQSPSGYDPVKNYNRLIERRNEVLHNLVEVGKISEPDFYKYRQVPGGINLRENTGRHFLEYVRKEALEIISQKKLKLTEDQLKITTSLDYRLQKICESMLTDQWNNLSQKMKELQAGIISVEPGTGYVRAMVGGNPESEARGLNRAVQIKRQPGSSFKAFLYGSMIKNGFTLAVPLMDTAIIVDKNKPTEWRPSNSDESSTGGPMPMIEAIQHSVNLAAAYAIIKLTNPDSVISFARLCGIKSYIPSYPSIALGTAEMSPLEMASAYAVFSSYGKYAAPISITKIEDKNGRLIYSCQIESSTVLDSADCFLLTDALQTVVDSGTASSVRHFYKGFAAGKTGTTQNSTDVWFAGYTHNLSTVIWMGYDSQKRKLSGGIQYGGTACAPLWGKIMNEYYGKNLPPPENTPPSIADVQLCVDSGELATERCSKKRYYYVSLEKHLPLCRIHFPVEKYDLNHSF